MGLYDTVTIKCPNCKHINLEQSKSGPCLLKTYSLQDAPVAVIEDLLSRNTFYCTNEDCDDVYHLQGEIKVTAKTVKGTSPKDTL